MLILQYIECGHRKKMLLNIRECNIENNLSYEIVTISKTDSNIDWIVYVCLLYAQPRFWAKYITEVIINE